MAQFFAFGNRFSIPIKVAVIFCLLGWTASQAATTCHNEVLIAEQANNIPQGLLLAMALVESGRGGMPHAHALSVGGRAIYAKSAKDAERYFRDRSGRLKRNVFVGCLQLSLKYHGQHFRPLHRIAEPDFNVAYAARYLARHYQTYGNWTKAVQRYQGGSARQRRAYVCKVWNALNALGRGGAHILDASNCRRRTVAVAPPTRRALRNMQVAEAIP